MTKLVTRYSTSTLLSEPHINDLSEVAHNGHGLAKCGYLHSVRPEPLLIFYSEFKINFFAEKNSVKPEQNLIKDLLPIDLPSSPHFAKPPVVCREV